MKGKLFSHEPLIAIDVGTTKICVLVAQQTGAESIELIGVGKAPSDGLSKGVVVDINKTIRSIKKAKEEAELMAGISIESACIGISGSHIHSINSQGVVPIKRKEVTHEDIKHVLESAKAVALPEGQQILHVLPQYYIIDGQDKVRDPLGMHGVRLEAQVHIITGSISSVQNLVKCCEQADIKVTDIVLEQLASALAVLSPDERTLGVGILDIGGGTSDFALYHNNSIIHTMVLPIAGNHFTNDLALGLRITLEDAECIKKTCGFAYQHDFQEGIVQVESVQGGVHKQVTLSALGSILMPRAEELFLLINKELKKYSFKPLMPAGLVLTGGGALLEGMQELAEKIFEMPVRIGRPRADNKLLLESLDHPKYATGYGLLLHVIAHNKDSSLHALQGALLQRLAARMKTWVSDFF
ncbi:MAG: cell division protein FtsA [Candidatus Babeliales bacterium]